MWDVNANFGHPRGYSRNIDEDGRNLFDNSLSCIFVIVFILAYYKRKWCIGNSISILESRSVIKMSEACHRVKTNADVEILKREQKEYGVCEDATTGRAHLMRHLQPIGVALAEVKVNCFHAKLNNTRNSYLFYMRYRCKLDGMLGLASNFQKICIIFAIM